MRTGMENKPSPLQCPKCRADILATNGRKLVPVAFPRTPSIRNAIMVGNVNTCGASVGVPVVQAHSQHLVGAASRTRLPQTLRENFPTESGTSSLYSNDCLKYVLNLLPWSSVLQQVECVVGPGGQNRSCEDVPRSGNLTLP